MYSDEPESFEAQSSVATDGTTRDTRTRTRHNITKGLGLDSIGFVSIPFV